jgi:DNA-directed RNA polymerase specialized sigma24 family protein
MKLAVNLEDFEGLIFTTTVRLMPYVEEDFDDVQQLLRIKVWKAYESYDPSRSRLPLKQYVFGCLVNYTKDIKKRRHRNVLFLEDLMPAPSDDGGRRDKFHAQYLALPEDQAFVAVEDEIPMLPNTLTDLERRVIGFLMLDYTATEISRTLGVGPKRLRAIRDKIEEKMADWRPTAESQVELLEAA